MEYEIFNLEKIKELIKPLDRLQGKSATLNLIYEDYQKQYESFLEIFDNDELNIQLKNTHKILEKLTEEIAKISNQNLSEFLFFHDLLIQKYKESFKESLKHIGLNSNNTKKLGLTFIEKKEVNKIVEKISFIHSLAINEWLEILISLKLNSIFLNNVDKIKEYFRTIIDSKLKYELEKIPEDTNLEIINKFKEVFPETQISFEDFLYDIENQLSAEEFKKKKQILEELKKKESLEEMKKKQQDQFRSSTYQEYIYLSDEEFERRRRKQRREKLSEIAEKPSKEVELSDDVLEKIEKFKSQFEKKFEEEYLIQKDDEMDPLDLIRERKKKKKEEYQKFIDKFKKEI